MYEGFIEVDRLAYEDFFDLQHIATEIKGEGALCKVVTNGDGAIVAIQDHCYSVASTKYYIKEGQ